MRYSLICRLSILAILLSPLQIFSQGKGTAVVCHDASIEMVFVTGGTFEMGSNTGKRDARPAHPITLNDFFIGKYEVTQAFWEAVMGYNPSELSGCPRCPVNDMSWEQLMVFLDTLQQCTGKVFRLPTEAEWEYAAQGGQHSKEYIYSGSNNIEEVAWLKVNSGERLHEVGLLKPNELGLYDMNGNAWELCQDWYNANFYKSSPSVNPVDTNESKYRVSRGASWMSPIKYCKRSARNIDHPHHKRGNGGIRLVMEP